MIFVNERVQVNQGSLPALILRWKARRARVYFLPTFAVSTSLYFRLHQANSACKAWLGSLLNTRDVEWLACMWASTSSDHVSVTLPSRECFYSGYWRSILSVSYYVLLVSVTRAKQISQTMTRSQHFSGFSSKVGVAN